MSTMGVIKWKNSYVDKIDINPPAGTHSSIEIKLHIKFNEDELDEPWPGRQLIEQLVIDSFCKKIKKDIGIYVRCVNGNFMPGDQNMKPGEAFVVVSVSTFDREEIKKLYNYFTRKKKNEK